MLACEKCGKLKAEPKEKGKARMARPECIQSKISNFLKSNKRWILVFLLEMGLCFGVSVVIFLFHPLEGYRIPKDLTLLVLNSFTGVFVALFGFTGLILTFTLGNLLTAKRELEKERFETNMKHAELEIEAKKVSQYTQVSTTVHETIENRLSEIKDNLNKNADKVRKVTRLGVMAVGSAVTCIIMNIWAFGDTTNGGMHFLSLNLLLILLFLCIDFIFEAIRTVIE